MIKIWRTLFAATLVLTAVQLANAADTSGTTHDHTPVDTTKTSQSAASDSQDDASVHFCFFEGKTYSEGSILHDDKNPVVCVRREWGFHLMGNKNSVPLVWEPVGSEHLNDLRKISHLKE